MDSLPNSESAPPTPSATSTTPRELEVALTAIHSTEKDPLLLRSKIQAETHIATLRQRSRAQRQIGRFYEAQNDQIDAMLKTFENHALDGEEGTKDNALKVKIAVYASFVANCALAILQTYAAVSSLSLSFFATAIDSVFDPGANYILNRLHSKSKKVDLTVYPAGGSKLTTIGNIVYAFAMLCVSIVLVAFSVQDLASHKKGEQLDFHLPAVIAVGIAFLTKLCLFFYCFTIRNASTQVQVLWEDHRNDLLINGLGIITSSLGSKLRWWIDPAGAIALSLIIIVSWSWTSYVQFGYLAGKAAPTNFQQLVVYKAMTFSDEVIQIDSCRVYHSGENFLVEVDIVMPDTTPLWKAHDVSQALQDQLESMPLVERAFVHVDHEVLHKPEHRKKQ